MGATWPAVGRRLTAGPCCRRGRTCVARPKPGCSSMPRWRRPRPRCRLISRRREAGMMRLLRTGLAIAILMALAGLAAWLADQPGRVQINWFGYLVETPAPVLALQIGRESCRERVCQYV